MSSICDCFPRLKETVLQREASYLAHPDDIAPAGPNAVLEVRVTSVGDLDELVDTNSGHQFIISEPELVGGRDIAPWPLEYLLGGAVGCFAAVFAFYAAKLDVKYDSFEATARTKINASGHMIPGAPPSGFQGVELDLKVASDEPKERLQEVERLALEGCPGIDTLRRPMTVSSVLDVRAASA